MSTEKQQEVNKAFDAWLTGELTDEQRKELLNSLESAEGEARVQEEMMRDYEGSVTAAEANVKTQIDAWLLNNMQAQPKVVRLRWWKYVAAAVVVLALSGMGYLFWEQKSGQTQLARQRYKNDLMPGGDKAILTLPDGSTLVLDGAHTGLIAMGNGGTVHNEQGVLSFNGNGTAVYQDIHTPVAGKIALKLSDGTRVWLDANSGIHFPTAFTGKTREVEVMGQAYFEVAESRGKPFLVHVKGETIRVLGTRFNVNSYAGEGKVKTTLIQGSVKVSGSGKDLVLKPGEEANGMALNTTPDINETVGWKEGEFRFNGANIETIMSQVARWYGAEIRYKDDISEEFVARIQRNVPVSELLLLLEATNQVHFEIEGKVITVSK
ncbi:FecR family protein [Filimonas lacunae]|uniref:FecR family protein n=1 Tax=Filimonas lacunae TaxID=477680 RepID=A0A173MIU4_9BACT|nr:FecR family protein [Filimonas lacunae]BAV07553.1 anti-sigma factor [Filimonas lacunae]SIT29974.1 FecR family protein [Filimonas lacunae]